MAGWLAQTLIGTIAGWPIYSEQLDVFIALGAMLILTGNLLNLRPSASTALVPSAGAKL